MTKLESWIGKGAVPYKPNKEKLDKLNKKRKQYTNSETSQLKLALK